MGRKSGMEKSTQRSVGAAGLMVLLVGLVALALSGPSAQAAPPEFASEVLADSPIGYWRLSELEGLTAVDSSGTEQWHVPAADRPCGWVRGGIRRWFFKTLSSARSSCPQRRAESSTSPRRSGQLVRPEWPSAAHS
jgi:hypothetical protein